MWNGNAGYNIGHSITTLPRDPHHTLNQGQGQMTRLCRIRPRHIGPCILVNYLAAVNRGINERLGSAPSRSETMETMEGQGPVT